MVSLTFPEDELNPTNDVEAPTKEPFVLSNDDVSFTPRYLPENFRSRKKRQLDRSQGFCKGEDVTDTGSKNREIHIQGRLVGKEIASYRRVVDSGEPFDLTFITWAGEVMVKNGEVEGPISRDSRSGEYQFQYTLDVVSTGRDEKESSGNYVPVTREPVEGILLGGG